MNEVFDVGSAVLESSELEPVFRSEGSTREAERGEKRRA